MPDWADDGGIKPIRFASTYAEDDEHDVSDVHRDDAACDVEVGGIDCNENPFDGDGDGSGNDCDNDDTNTRDRERETLVSDTCLGRIPNTCRRHLSPTLKRYRNCTATLVLESLSHQRCVLSTRRSTL